VASSIQQEAVQNPGVLKSLRQCWKLPTSDEKPLQVPAREHPYPWHCASEERLKSPKKNQTRTDDESSPTKIMTPTVFLTLRYRRQSKLTAHVITIFTPKYATKQKLVLAKERVVLPFHNCPGRRNRGLYGRVTGERLPRSSCLPISWGNVLCHSRGLIDGADKHYALQRWLKRAGLRWHRSPCDVIFLLVKLGNPALYWHVYLASLPFLQQRFEGRPSGKSCFPLSIYFQNRKDFESAFGALLRRWLLHNDVDLLTAVAAPEPLSETFWPPLTLLVPTPSTQTQSGSCPRLTLSTEVHGRRRR